MDMEKAKLEGADTLIFEAHQSHTTGVRIHTDSAISHAILQQYPNRCVTATKTDLIIFAEAGNAHMQLVTDGPPLLLSRDYGSQAPNDPLGHDEEPDPLTSRIYFGCYDYKWLHYTFRVFVVNVQNHLGPTATDTRSYIVSEAAKDEVAGRSISKDADALIRAVGLWSKQSHREVWLFDEGKWQKNRALWIAVRDARFEDVVSKAEQQIAIKRDTLGFFDAREQYAQYGVPWKRGLIFHGPPGNGKTMTIKSIMRALTDKSVPTLYVKSIASRAATPQAILRFIFNHAREMAPCLLIFEDIDSIVTEEVKSYFFNEVDGLDINHGILMIGSTNHLEKLDIGLSQRPGRFDRKYAFGLPGREERLSFCHRWNNKLEKTPLARLDTSALEKIASMSTDFSYAYLNEAYISALLSLARQDDNEAVAFAAILESQIEALRRNMKEEGIMAESS